MHVEDVNSATAPGPSGLAEVAPPSLVKPSTSVILAEAAEISGPLRNRLHLLAWLPG